MQRVRRLRKLRLAVRWRLRRLEDKLNGVGSKPRSERDLAVAYVTIEALNAWVLFSRSFYLSCAIGARTERNRRAILATPLGTDHLGAAISHYKKSAKPNSHGQWHRRDEPAWHDPNVLMTVCKNLGCSVQNELEAAFSMQQTVFRDLPVFRNFFAHRNQGTSGAARNIAPLYTLPTYLTPAELLMSTSPGAYAPLLVTWLDEIRITVEFICRG